MAKKRTKPTRRQNQAVATWGYCGTSSTMSGFGFVRSQVIGAAVDQKGTVMTGTRESLVEGIAKLFNNSEYADIKVYLGQVELPVHSVVVATQSLYFRKALNGKFHESQTKQLRFTEGSPHAYWRAIEYMYTGKYSEEPTQVLEAQDDDELVKDVRVYIVADYFLMDELKNYAFEKFQSKLEKLWVSELFIDCIREIYTSTTESAKRLRDAVVGVVRTHLGELWARKAFQDLVHDGGDFAKDLVARFATGDKPW